MSHNTTHTEPPFYVELLCLHRVHLREGGISDEVIDERGYFTVSSMKQFRGLGFADFQWAGQGLILPVFPPLAKQPSHHVYRPDNPKDPKRKYLGPCGQPSRLDVPPRCHSNLGDPSIPLWITEGQKKADALATHDLCAMALFGVWNWRGTNDAGGKTTLGDWESIALQSREVVIAFDGDAGRKPSVRIARQRLTEMLRSKGVATVRWVILPDEAIKVGVDDYLRTHSIAELQDLIIDAPHPPDLPKFPARNPKVSEQSRDVWSSLLVAGVPLYMYGGMLVYLDYDSEGALQMTPVDRILMTYLLSSFVTLAESRVRNGVAGPEVVEIEHSPPHALSETMAHVTDSQVPMIRSIERTPRFRPNGTMISEPGYDAATRVYYDPAIPLLAIPDDPTKVDLDAAKALILTQLLGDFEFDEESDLAHAISLLLEPFVRPIVGCKVPIHLFEASTQGTGKGLLADVLTYPGHGSWIAWSPEPESDAEFRKRITASLIGNEPIFGIDNVKQVLSSGALAAAVTTEIWKDRELGTSRNVTGMIPWSWILTANNLIVDADISRRIIRSRLIALQEDPSKRDDFTHPNLKKWVIDHEAELLQAVLTIIQYWVKRGMPDGSRTLGSFEQGAKTIGGILETVEIPGFLDQTDEPVDPVKEAWRTLVVEWRERFGSHFVTISQLYDLAREKEIPLPLSGKDEKGERRSFGLKLRSQKDRIYGSLRIVQAPNASGGVNAWVLQDSRDRKGVRSVKSVSSTEPRGKESKDRGVAHDPDTSDTPNTANLDPQSAFDRMTS